MSKSRGWLRGALYGLPLVYLLLFFFYPLYAILQLSLAPEGSLDLSTLAELLRSPLFAKTLGFTVWQATLSTLLTLLAALPAAHVFAKYTFPGKAFLQALTTIPFVMPAVVVAAAFAATLGPRGWLNQLLMALFHREQPLLNLQHTLWIILLAHVFYNYTVILRMVGGFWANLGPRLEEAARALGADPWHTFGEVTLPLLRPAILAAALLVFIFDFTSFGVILILGGSRFATLEVEIYQQTVNLFNLPLAAALSLTQIGFTFISMWLYTHLQAASSVPLPLRAQRLVQRRPQTAREIVWVAANIGFMVVLLLTPLLALVERSLLGRDGYGVDHYLALFTNPRGSILFVPPLEAVRNSLLVAAATVALAVGLGLLAADLLTQRKGVIRATLDPIFMLPLGTSAVTLGFGYILALDEPPLNLRASPLLLPLAHGLVAFPFVVRSLLPVLRSIHPHLREAAAVLGASPGRVWREIDLPIVSPALLVGSVFAFTISLGEFGATSLIARPEFPTMPVAIFRFLGQPGALNYGQALAMSSLLMLVCSLGILAIERFRSGERGEF